MAHFEDECVPRPEVFNFATDVVDYWASKSPNLLAVHWVSRATAESRKLDYSHFSRQSHRIALMLQKLGIQPGQKLIIILPRIPAWWEIAVAAIRSGIVLCPSTTLLVDKDIEYRARVSNSTAFIGDETSVQNFLRVWKRCPQVTTVLQVGGHTAEGVIPFSDVLHDIPEDATFSRHPNPATDAALIYFTSGTSGPPKMVLHNQISYPLAHTITGKYWLRLKPGKLYWNLAEQGWAKAAWAFFGAWNCGAALFVEDDRKPFDPIHFIDVLHSYSITTVCAPPTAYRQLVLEAGQMNFSKNPPAALEHCVGAGEPLNGEAIKIWERMSGLQIHDGYGQTETILVCGNFEGTPIRPGSMGKPAPGIHMALLDESGKQVPPGTEGNIAILVEGSAEPNQGFFGIFDGYITENGRIQRTMCYSVEKDGIAVKRSWFLTGDRAKRDVAGYFWFVGRADDIINSSGYRIGPYEVESVLKQHPGIVECAVVASPDPKRVEVVKAFVVLTAEYAQRNENNLRREIQDFCKRNSAPYKYPRRIQFVEMDFLPKTVSGKIMRKELRKRERERQQNAEVHARL